MGFKKTSEGRVYFKNPDNDDNPASPVKPAPSSQKAKAIPQPANKTPSATSNAAAPKSDSVLPKDQMQMQILLLLKSLNTKLKSSREDNTEIKKQLVTYKATIKELEDSAKKQQKDYLDLEQKFAKRQNESTKKTSRVEENLKTTLGQIEEAKKLVSALEEKSNESLQTLKTEIEERKQKEEELTKKQKTLETAQKEQGVKMVDNVAAYTALTKRVGEAETRADVLENKIEENTSEYMKLDRKIDKMIEDRNRILRKVERIEHAVLETRDALNAKAMVLLTDQGIAGVNMPQLADQTLQTDPLALQRRLHEEAMLPWWRKPVRIQMTSLILVLIVVMLLGWILSAARQPAQISSQTLSRAEPPTITLPIVEPQSLYEENDYNTSDEAQKSSSWEKKTGIEDNLSAKATADAAGYMPEYERYETPTALYDPTFEEEIAEVETPDAAEIDTTSNSDYGIRIHKGAKTAEDIQTKTTAETRASSVNVLNTNELEETFNRDENAVAIALNDIEPGEPSSPTIPVTAISSKPQVPVTSNISSDYLRDLKSRIKPDPSLTPVTKKIENQAFKGVPEAQHDMGAIYVSGNGRIKKDLSRAALWFTEAANNGVANAKYNLGVLYHQGMGVKSDLDKAISLYDEAAKMGHPEAQYNLGIANIEGIGTPYNPGRAARYFENAASQGITEAAYNLGLIYENGLLGDVRPDLALSWYKRAADSGSPEAQAALQQLASSLGIDVRDIERAIASNSQPPKNDSSLISSIQKELMRRGLYPGPVDGVIGPMTKNAIETFQRAAEIPVTGKESADLLQYLKSGSTY